MERREEQEEDLPKEDLPKAGLVLGKHYVGVNEECWLLLAQLYGGGPTIRREHLQLYNN